MRPNWCTLFAPRNALENRQQDNIVSKQNISIRHRVMMLTSGVIAVPLVLGGLIAAGESGDARILIFGTVATLAACLNGLPRALSPIRLLHKPTDTTS